LNNLLATWMFTNQNSTDRNSYFMNLALQQARKVLGNTGSNPAVGCVITKDDNVISAGFTSINGRPHAETNAINLYKNKLNYSNIYITLEPCSHHGKTPPCVNLIIKKKIKKVFFSINDPDQRSYKKSIKILKKHKIKVNNNILKNEVNLFYKSYIKSKKNVLPYVSSKIAISKDYYTVDKKNKWITNLYSRGRVHLIRSFHDCIITSSRTINTDNSRLTCRINGLVERSPSRIILDKDLKVKISSKIIKEAKVFPTIIFFNKNNKNKINLLKKYKVKLYKIPLNSRGLLDLKKTLIKSKELGFSRILLESGLSLTSNFLKEKLIDNLIVFISKKSLGKNGLRNMKKNLNYFTKRKKKKIVKVNLFKEKLIFYKLK